MSMVVPVVKRRAKRAGKGGGKGGRVRGKGKRAARTQTAMRALKLPRKPFILRLGSRCHLTSSFRDLRLFLELALRGFVSFYLRFLFFNSRAVFPSSTLPPLPPPPLPPAPSTPRNPSAAHSSPMLTVYLCYPASRERNFLRR